MPTQNTENSSSSPFEVITSRSSKKVSKKGLIIGSIVAVFLALSVVAGVLLVRQQQNIQEKAAAVNLCPAAEACPVAGQADVLMSCTTPNTDGSPQSISCSSISNVGMVTSCGSSQYCCPSLGASWTTDLALCSTPSPTPTITPTSVATSSTIVATSTPTSTASATPKVQKSPLPMPVTGTGWPTFVGAGVGAVVIIGSILLVL